MSETETARPKLFLTRKFPDDVDARAASDYDAALNPDDIDYTPEQVGEKSRGMDGVMCSTTNMFDAKGIGLLAESVRILATFSVGVDHFDLEAAKARGIVVTNTPGVMVEATADIAMLLMLTAARRSWEGTSMVREGRWEGWAPTQLMGMHLGGKRLGILGMGRIGQAVARRAGPFGLTVHYHNRNRLAPELEDGAEFHHTAEDLLRVSDFLSIHTPMTPDLMKFLNSERIGLLPEGAVVVNTSRGAVIDDEALIEALKSGRLAAAGLDVFDGEPDLHKGYRELDNAFLLPHQGSGTVETRTAMGFMALDNLDAFFSGTEPPNRVA